MERFPGWMKFSFLVILILITVSGLLFYGTQKDYRRTQIEAELAGIAHLKADGIAAWRQERLADGATLADNIFLSRQIKLWLETGEPVVIEEIKSVLQSLMRNYHYYEVLIL